jgi:hypothetical protein
VLDERAHARRAAVLPAVERADGHRLGLPVRQHAPQRTALEVLVHEPRRQQGDAGSVDGERAQRGGGIAVKHSIRNDARLPLSIDEGPAVPGATG